MFSKNKKKYSCCFCSSLDKIGKSKVVFCRDCIKIRDYIRDKGLNNILSIVINERSNSFTSNINESNQPTAPPYK